MKVTIINGLAPAEPEVAVHRAGCRDIAKYRRNDKYTADYDSKSEAWNDYNADFLEEESGAWPLTFLPCTKGLEDGGEYNL